MTKAAVFACSLLLVSVSLFGQMDGDGSKPLSWRKHYKGFDAVSGAKYELTEITQLPNEGESRHTVLLDDQTSKDRLILKFSLNYFDHEATTEIYDPDTKETATAKNPLPFKSITRRGAAEESRTNPEVHNGTVPIISINVNGVQFTASEDEWTSPKMREQVSAIRRAASPRFLERIERLRAISAETPIGVFCAGLLRFILYNHTCERSLIPIEVAAPDCAFDASFRYDCSQASKDRIAKAKDRGEPIEVY